MSRITISRADNVIYIDGVPEPVDCSQLPSYLRVIQWDGEAGEIEWVPDVNGKVLPNTKFNDITPYMALVNEHYNAKDKRKKEQEDERKRLKDNVSSEGDDVSSDGL